VKNKKVHEFLGPIHGDIIHIMIDPVAIPKLFEKVNSTNEMKQAYKKVYTKISSSKFGMGISSKK